MQPSQDQNYWHPSADESPQLPVLAEVPEDPISPRNSEPSPVSGVVQPITWQASEFVHHDKSSQWFLALFGIALLLLAIDYFLIKSWTFGALIVVMAVSAAVVARRPPRTLTYTLSAQGVRIDDKTFSFHDFRSFGVVPEGAFYSIRLIPTKRFMPMVSIYFPPEEGEQIVDLFGAMLPMEQIELDSIDKLVEKIRF